MRKPLILTLMFSVLGCASLKSIGADDRSLSSASSKATPRLFIQPAPVFDMVCAQKTGFKIDSTRLAQYQQELHQKMPQFQSAWDSRAAHLISESERAAGRAFKRKEYSVAMILCDWIPMGDPAFIVSAFPYLGPPRKMNGFDMPAGMSAFVSMTHHELLHRFPEHRGKNHLTYDPHRRFDQRSTSKILEHFGSRGNSVRRRDNRARAHGFSRTLTGLFSFRSGNLRSG